MYIPLNRGVTQLGRKTTSSHHIMFRSALLSPTYAVPRDGFPFLSLKPLLVFVYLVGSVCCWAGFTTLFYFTLWKKGIDI